MLSLFWFFGAENDLKCCGGVWGWVWSLFENWIVDASIFTNRNGSCGLYVNVIFLVQTLRGAYYRLWWWVPVSRVWVLNH